MAKKKPDPVASAMARKRWDKTTKKERLKFGRKLTKSRIRLRKERSKTQK